MSKFYITPRLNFDFSFKDLITAVKGVFSNKDENSKFGDFFPDSEIYFTNHARTGMLLVLQALQLPKGSKIGVIVYNCLTVFEAIKKAGYNPVFIDVDYNYRMNLEDLRRKENELDAIVVTHLFGIESNILEILDIMKERPVVEDCAHSFLNKLNNKYLGSYGIASVFSFGHAKFPAAAEGGVVVINENTFSSNFRKSLSLLENYKKSKALKNIFKAYFLSILMNKYIYKFITSPLKTRLNDDVDINQKYVFHEKLCNTGFRKVFDRRMKNIDDLIRMQKDNAYDIASHFEKLSLTSAGIKNDATFMVPIRMKYPDKFIQNAKKNGVELGRHFLNSHKWASNYESFNGSFPIAEELLRETVTIPCHYRLTKNDISNIKSLEVF